MECYKGLIIPPLPEKKYLGNLKEEFIDKRRAELETFLRVIATHTILKFDKNLENFLKIEDFEHFKSNPTAYEKVLSLYDYIPSVKNLSVNGVKSAL